MFQELMQNRGLTQSALARMAGCSQSYISHIAKGRRQPSWRKLEAFAKALSVAPEELYRLLRDQRKEESA